MIAAMLAADSEEDFVDAVRAYDRILLSGFFIIPLFHSAEQWAAYWGRITHPAALPLFGLTNTSPIEYWWRTAP